MSLFQKKRHKVDRLLDVTYKLSERRNYQSKKSLSPVIIPRLHSLAPITHMG